MNYDHYFKGKKVTVMRIGLLGRGVGDATFLAEQGAEVLVVDDASQGVMQPSVDALAHFSNVRFKFGPYDPSDFTSADYILKGAGARQDEPALVAARNAGVPIKMSASWFAEIAGIPTVGVTGTRGKSTTTMMIHEIMKAAGMEVLLGGNIRGVSTLALLPQVTPNSIGLFELDSWQCQGWGEAKMSPDVAVFTTFMDDHLNYYGGDREKYLDDKAQIFLHQKPEDTLVVGEQTQTVLQKYKTRMKAHVVVAKAGKLSLKVPGVHNQLNAACALAAARALGIDDEISIQVLADFKGVEGRLQLVREWHGVKIYNDTTATVPDATLAALDALSTRHPTSGIGIILIMGGADKGLDMSALVARLPALKKVLYLAGTGTSTLEVTDVYDSLAAAFSAAVDGAVPGDIILFSPAFASFGMFKNEYDRGDQFNALVNAL